MLDYLRYTHRVAVSSERIGGIDAQGGRLRVRVDHCVARFLQHVQPPGSKRIRHCRLLSPTVVAPES
jgi:Putative transposase